MIARAAWRAVAHDPEIGRDVALKRMRGTAPGLHRRQRGETDLVMVFAGLAGLLLLTTRFALAITWPRLEAQRHVHLQAGSFASSCHVTAPQPEGLCSAW